MAEPPTRDAPSQPDPAEQFLHDFLSASPQQRRELLAKLRENEPDRAQRVEKLLAQLDGIGFLTEPDEAAPGLPEQIGEHRILRVLGAGGMGVVYLAEHQKVLGRRVALKVLHERLARTPKARQRFRREALAATRLDHPNICTVYEAGTDGDTLYLAMQLVPGETLAQRIEDCRQRQASQVDLPTTTADHPGPDSAPVLRLVERTAMALHAAHETGLVHRDVKPGNLMVTPDGEPVLLDFGLARIEDDATGSITLSGDHPGTPAYMAPEQITDGPITPTTDVYALGAVLYECLTLQPPFTELNRESLFRQILREDPRDPRRANRAIGGDLWTVLRTALAKEPGRRYPTAAAFAEDLRRVREREPILAKPPGPWLRMRRFAQRHPAAACLLGFSLVAAIAFAVLLEQRSQALEEKKRALVQQEHLLAQKQVVELALRADKKRSGAPAEALELTLEAVQAERNLDTVSAFYMAMVQSRERVRLWHNHAVWRAKFSPDGRRILSCSDDHTARLWDRQGNLLHVMPHDRFVIDCRFSHEGDRVATAARDGSAAIWDLAGNRLHRLEHGPWFKERERAATDSSHSSNVRNVRWSHDDRYLTTACNDRKARIWDTQSGKMHGPPITAHNADVGAVFCRVAWSPTELLFATFQGNRRAQVDELPQKTNAFVWRPNEYEHERVACLPHPGGVDSLEFTADGRHLLTTCADGYWRLWDLRKPDAPVAREKVGRVIFDAGLTPDGQHVLASSTDRRMQLWPLQGGQPRANRRFLSIPIPAPGPHRSLAIGEGPWNLVCGADMALRVLDPDLIPAFELRGHSQPLVDLCTSPNGRQVASASWDWTARIWDIVDDAMPRLLGHLGPVRALDHGPDGSIVSMAQDGSLRIWDLDQLTSRRITIDEQPTMGLAMAPDLQSAAVVFSNGRVERYDLATGQDQRLPVISDEGMSCAQYLADRRLVIGGGREDVLHGYTADGSEAIRYGTQRYMVLAMDRAPNRNLVAAVGRASITLWDAASGSVRQSWPNPHGTWRHAVAFSRDEQRLAVGGVKGLLEVWDLGYLTDPPDAAMLFTGHTGRVTSVAWSPDGEFLASASSDGSACLWNAHTGDPIAILQGHRGRVRAVLFTETDNGDLLLTAGDDGAIQAWPTDLDALIELAEQRVAALQRPAPVYDRIIEAATRYRLPHILCLVAQQILTERSEGGARDLDLALRAAQLSVEFNEVERRKPAYLWTLAKVHASRRDYEQAAQFQARALELIPVKQTQKRKAYKKDLERYRKAAGK